MGFPLPDKLRKTRHRFVDVDGLTLFYREAGDRARPPSCSCSRISDCQPHVPRPDPQLAEQYHLIAPDFPGFGMSEQPPRDQFAYTFDNVAHVIDRFTEVLGLAKFAIYVFDYGAPVAFRIAVKHPERITAIVTQNGNAYEEGLSAGWNPIQQLLAGAQRPDRAALRTFLTPDDDQVAVRARRARRVAGRAREFGAKVAP